MIKVLMCGNHPSNKGGMTSVISQLRSYEWEKSGIKMKFIPTFYPANNIVKAGYFGIAYLKIAFSMLVDKPDIVHMHMSYKGSFRRKYLIHKLCKFFKVKDIIHLHGGAFEKWYNEADEKTQKKVRRLLRESDVCFVLGEKWKEKVRRIESGANIIVIHNAVPIPKDVVEWNAKKCQILYMGVLIEAKGLNELLEAFLDLKKEGKLQNMHLAIAGSGPEEAKLKEYCKINCLGEKIDFHGWISGTEKERLILDSQIMILPSYNEGLPISILEALSYGMPVIATDVGDMASAVKDQENGYLIQPQKVEQIVEKLELLNNSVVFRKMSKKARELAECEFSETKFFEMITRSYYILCGVKNDEYK